MGVGKKGAVTGCVVGKEERHAGQCEASLLVSNPNGVVEMLRVAQHDVLLLIFKKQTAGY
jgi:hypothetical protein